MALPLGILMDVALAGTVSKGLNISPTLKERDLLVAYP